MPDLEADRDPVEVLAAEFVERQRRDQKPTIEEYASTYPQWADRIRDLFPAVVAMERLKRQHIQSSSDEHLSQGIGKLERLGDFRILAEIGRGGMGIVYEAEQLSLGRHVAVKVLPKQALLDAKQLRRFEREAQTAARLHHTNIVPVFGVGQQDGYHYFVMQYIRGVGLDKVLVELRQLRVQERQTTTDTDNGQGELPRAQRAWARRSAEALLQGSYWQNVATLGYQVAEALDYAHGQSTLHRDIKPGNLLLDAQNVVWVADFGLAKATEQDDVSHTNDVIGTLRYMAPERFEGQADARSDIYSLGLTLYELLALRPAFNEPDRSSLIQQILHATPPSPKKFDESMPADLETIVLKAIAREPQHRYQSAAALATDLDCFLNDLPITASRTSAAERAWRWCRRNRAVAALAATAVSLLFLVAIVASVGYVRTRSALSGEQTQRRKAEATTQLAIEALDKIYEQFAPNRFAAATELTVEDPEGESYQVPIQPVLSNQAAALLENMLAFYDRLAAQGIDQVEYRQKAAEANRRVGDIQQRLGQFEQAKAAYQRALDFYLELRKGNPDKTNVAAETARVYNELGNVYARLGQREKVVAAHTEALSILQATPAPAGDQPVIRYELARAHYYLGQPFRGGGGPTGGRRGGGRPPGRDARDQRPRRERPSETPEPATADANRLRPPSPPEDRQPPPANIEHLEKASQILERLIVDSPSVPDYRHLLARCYRSISRVWGRSDPQRAATADKKATTILEELVRDFPDVPDYRYDLSETYARQAMTGMFRRQQDDPKAQQRLRDALDIAEKLVAEHPNVPDYAESLARIHFSVGLQLARSDDVEDAQRAMQQATATQQTLVERHPKILLYVVRLAMMRTQQARFLRDHEQLDAARTALESSIASLKQIAKSRATQQGPVGYFLATSYSMLADVLQRQDKKELANEAAEQAKQQWDQLRARGRGGQPGDGRPGDGRRGQRGPGPRREAEPSRTSG